MVLSPVMIVVRNFGIVTVVNDTSNIEKLLRKKYMGVWRWASSRVRMIMVRFPVMLRIMTFSSAEMLAKAVYE